MSAALIYGDLNANAVDGSSVWLVSMAQLLSEIFDDVYLQLRNRQENEIILSSLNGLQNVTVLPPPDNVEELDSDSAADEVERFMGKTSIDAVIVRGFDACHEFATRSIIARVQWSYITDLPFPPDQITAKTREKLSLVTVNSFRMFAQTEDARAYLESVAPAAAGKTILLNPMIPDDAVLDRLPEDTDTPDVLRMVYVGKFAKAWHTLEMLQLPGALRRLGIEATLTVVGNKFNAKPGYPQWPTHMKEALEDAHLKVDSGVTWLGVLSRREALEQIRSAHIGLGWRSAELDASLELSTKALEYGASGVAPLVNRNDAHEQLFGDDYPLLVDGMGAVEDIAKNIVDALPHLRAARQKAYVTAQSFTMGRAILRLKSAFSRAGCLERHARTPRKKLLVVSHDFKFLGDAMSRFQADSRFEVDVDVWESLRAHDEAVSVAKANWADVVFCEFAGPFLGWYADHIGDGVRLVTRLHGFEVRNMVPWLSSFDVARVDAWVTVSEVYRDMVVDRLSIPESRVSIIPNMIDVSDFDRPKTADASCHLGLVGYVPFLKRPDRALELLRLLVGQGHDYVLHLKGRVPWDYPYVWNDGTERAQYLELFSQIEMDPGLSSHIIIESFSADIANWHRGIGVILSPSNDESFHLAVAEGMAARTIPAVWDRPGASTIFGQEHVRGTLDDLANDIVMRTAPDAFCEWGERARQYAMRWDVSVIYDDIVEQLEPNIF